jgi:putative membrane protein
MLAPHEARAGRTIMSHQSFFAKDAKEKAKKTVLAVEAQTSAEILLAVRPRSGHYRHADYLAGSIAAFAALLLLLFLPQTFTVDTMPLDVLGAFALGAVLTANLPPLRRLLAGRKRLAESVRTAARAAFVDDGVARTTRRTGILVYASVFEQRVEIVADVGVDPKALGEAWEKASRALEGSLAGGADLDRFLAAVTALGPALATALPHHEGDRDELSDEMDLAS